MGRFRHNVDHCFIQKAFLARLVFLNGDDGAKTAWDNSHQTNETSPTSLFRGEVYCTSLPAVAGMES
jgi:hypothetical protein